MANQIHGRLGKMANHFKFLIFALWTYQYYVLAEEAKMVSP